MHAVIRGKQLHSLTTKISPWLFLFIFEYKHVDKQSSFVWLRQDLHSETQSSIIAIQNRVIATRVSESKMMYKSVATIYLVQIVS